MSSSAAYSSHRNGGLSSEREQELLERIAAQEEMLRSTMDYMYEVQQKLEEKQAVLEQKSREIMDSVNYAKLIQDAIMPDPKDIAAVLPEHFILHRQRDVIGGDFPYVRRSGKYLYMAAVDCVGHGIPGAMLSAMAHYALNEVLLRNGISRIDEIPAKSFQLMAQNLHSHGGRSVGFDMALCRFDTEAGTLHFCGAGRPLYLVRKGEVHEFKGSRFGMNMDHPAELTSQEIPVQKGDRVFLFSDGFSDQFGGPNDRKFSSARLRALLASTSQLRMKKQKEVINDVFMDWKRSTEQTDDILMIGAHI